MVVLRGMQLGDNANAKCQRTQFSGGRVQREVWELATYRQKMVEPRKWELLVTCNGGKLGGTAWAKMGTCNGSKLLQSAGRNNARYHAPHFKCGKETCFVYVPCGCWLTSGNRPGIIFLACCDKQGLRYKRSQRAATVCNLRMG